MAKKGKSKPAKTETVSKGKKKKHPEDYEKGMFREVAEILLYGLGLLLFCKTFVWQNFQIPTSSMENSLLIGDHITANTFVFKNAEPWERNILPYRDVKRGDVIVFKYPGAPREDWIKRCIGLPGDTYEVRKDEIILNGEVLDEEYAFYKRRPARDEVTRCPDIGYRPCDYYDLKPGLKNAEQSPGESVSLKTLIAKTRVKLAPYRRVNEEVYNRVIERLNAPQPEGKTVIPEGFYLMMGDNRNNSADSRSWGLVPHEFVEGRAYFLWWSYGEDEGSHQLEKLDLVWSYLRVPIEFFRRTHWEETFTRIK